MPVNASFTMQKLMRQGFVFLIRHKENSAKRIIPNTYVNLL